MKRLSTKCRGSQTSRRLEFYGKINLDFLSLRHASDCLFLFVPKSANTEETILMGYRIPKRSFILPNFLAVNTDPKLWENPLIFKPERFLNADGKLREPPYFMPFSIGMVIVIHNAPSSVSVYRSVIFTLFFIGKRSCVGESLARMELFLFFGNILQQFTLTAPDEFPLPSVHDCITTISCTPLPFYVNAKPRLSH